MLSFFPRGVLDEILNLIESVSEGFPSYSWLHFMQNVMKYNKNEFHFALEVSFSIYTAQGLSYRHFVEG